MTEQTPEPELLRSYRSILDHSLMPYLRVMRYRDSLVGTMMSGIEAVRDDELEHLRAELDIAKTTRDETHIWTNTDWKQHADAAQAVIARILDLHSGPRTERHGSCCVDCGRVWPCPTRRALDGHDYPGQITVSLRDLDLVMNHAGNPATVAEYPAAAQRIQAAIERGRRP